jgi:hypothetical protein
MGNNHANHNHGNKEKQPQKRHNYQIKTNHPFTICGKTNHYTHDCHELLALHNI